MRCRTLLPLALACATAFPQSGDPITADPPAAPAGAEPCDVVTLFENATCSGYNLVLRRPWGGAPSACGGAWARVVLRFDGAVSAGTQFDRYGALWFDGVELLRTTTPEPNAVAPIAWRVSKDVTRYSALFASADAAANATLTIPNTVDAQYDGVITVNASLAFYAGAAPAGLPDAVIALASPVANLTANPWGAMQVDGNCSAGTCALSAPTPVFRNAVSATLDVYASGHSCEEFWYANAPTDIADKFSGGCGGGSYRRIDVFVDGVLAGATTPFPVVYSGGLDPLLWRPLAGIESFDIPAYRFDLSPFCGPFNDGAPHNISIDVVGNSPSGHWCTSRRSHGRVGDEAEALSPSGTSTRCSSSASTRRTRRAPASSSSTTRARRPRRRPSPTPPTAAESPHPRR